MGEEKKPPSIRCKLFHMSNRRHGHSAKTLAVLVAITIQAVKKASAVIAFISFPRFRKVAIKTNNITGVIINSSEQNGGKERGRETLPLDAKIISHEQHEGTVTAQKTLAVLVAITIRAVKKPQPLLPSF
ncbi:hypothetical protein CEXT_266241 [Caerostris extrusa]|uniref:Uncharacterized protein n=1 Tax=Caerostris extrusa TaxID=172846 RepID=A0AAV4PAS5_CAEEX|nr:hypothetical protein CEXT_266241 [Caerostris extrusa]